MTVNKLFVESHLPNLEWEGIKKENVCPTSTLQKRRRLFQGNGESGTKILGGARGKKKKKKGPHQFKKKKREVVLALFGKW